jgi:uncharacterized protein
VWFDYFERHLIYYFVAGIWIFQIVFSIAWLKYFQFGPFEWLWRSLSYWKRQPMKRTTTMLAPGVAPVAI